MIKYKLISAVFIFGILLFFENPKLHAQQRDLNCTQKLNQAEDMFDAGSLSDIPDLLNSNRGKCFNKGGFSKEEKIRAYRLLALVHLFNDNGPEAEDAVINLLSADPEHPLSPDDPIELKYLFDKYRSDPIFRIGLKAGVNQTYVRSIGEFGSYSNETEVSKEFKPGIGFQAEITFEYTIFENFEALAGIGWMQSTYDISYNSITSLSEDYPESSIFVVSLTETQSQLKAPLMVRYGYPVGNFIPYAVLGVSFDYLLSSTISGSRSGTATRQLTSLSLLDNKMRREINWSYFGGLGVKLKTKTNFVLLEARYNMGGSNTVRQAYRYNNEKLLYDMAHVDDDKILNNLNISLGYIMSIYKPKKYSNKKLEKKFGKKNSTDE